MSPDYVFSATIPWAYSWLWEQNLAHAVAARHKVLYIDPPISPLSPLKRANRNAEVLGMLAGRRARPEGRLHVYRPVALPPLDHRVTRRASAPLVRRQLRSVARGLGIERPVLVSARAWTGLEGSVGEVLRVHFVLDWLEAGAELLGRPREELAEETDRACREADLVCAISNRLVEGLVSAATALAS